MKVTVTQRHIDEGRKNIISLGVAPRAAWCPIALAVRELTNKKYDVIASTYYIRIGDDRYHTPTKAHMFMIDFDRGNPVKPFEFELSH